MAEETKTLPELLAEFKDIIPLLDALSDRILRENPDILLYSLKKDPNFDLGRFAGIAILDFLVYAYGKETRDHSREPYDL